MNKEFLHSISHELKSPLNSILTLSEVLLMQADSRLTVEEKEYLRIIERNGKKLLALINDLIEVFEIDSGIQLSITDVMLASVLQNICERYEGTLRKKGLQLHLQCEDIVLSSDEARMYQIFENLIDNAVKFTEEGSITISAYRKDGQCVVSIADTGIGIRSEYCDLLFTGFTKASGSLSSKYPGTGLGLTIVARLVAILGGSIHVESQLGKGSVFTVRFPLQTETVIPIQQRKTILVIDDDPDSIVVVKALLSKLYDIVEAHSAQEGVMLARDSKPACILLDLSLPDLHGLQVVKQLKNDALTQNIPVIIVSASSLKHEKATILASGCDDFIQKPFSIEEFILKVRHWVK
ncbi:MAG: hybrid sensor histidine kinase/response regulator [Spirochaetes bacterium]|nr:hybrid sensor histidine kinase/response regulator [Spirochaetota bacterium]